MLKPEATAHVPDAPLRQPGPVDDRGLRQLVDNHWVTVGRVLRHMGVPQADLDDALQEVFWVAARKSENIQPGCERAFLLATAYHVAARSRRAQGKALAREVQTEVEAADPALSPEDQLDRERALQQLDQILDTMDWDMRSVFVLYEVEEMTMAEIADVLQLPKGTVASRLRRGRELFQGEARRIRARAGSLR